MKVVLSNAKVFANSFVKLVNFMDKVKSTNGINLKEMFSDFQVNVTLSATDKAHELKKQTS